MTKPRPVYLLIVLALVGLISAAGAHSYLLQAVTQADWPAVDVGLIDSCDLSNQDTVTTDDALFFESLQSESVASSVSCIPASKCCKICTTDKACGNACISRKQICRGGRGCACNCYEVCPD